MPAFGRADRLSLGVGGAAPRKWGLRRSLCPHTPATPPVAACDVQRGLEGGAGGGNAPRAPLAREVIRLRRSPTSERSARPEAGMG